MDFIDVDIAKLGDDKDNTILLDGLHQDREVTLDIRWHLDINTSLELLTLTGGGVTDLHEVNLLTRFSSFLLAEAED